MWLFIVLNNKDELIFLGIKIFKVVLVKNAWRINAVAYTGERA